MGTYIKNKQRILKAKDMWRYLVFIIVSVNSKTIKDGSILDESKVFIDSSIDSERLGLFDGVRVVTKEIGKPDDETAINSNDDTMKDKVPGSSFIGGLFQSLRDLTKDLSKLAFEVGAELSDDRQEVVDLAEQVEDEVSELEDAMENWADSIDLGKRNSTGIFNITLDNGKLIQTGNYSTSVKVTKKEDEDVVEEELKFSWG